ncbi:hypothetical protein HYH02_007371 [Chlamydomonas schloesseri]|uniref:Uncharacterized protein n=1 Tax=Chlamydomonas schloesseri TaxID=2026947 RepID=A0A835WIB5_9CHLO|nr:hypothetical protein HYH02_007371 [Chlamydomonas schloesseri]|eukprot:KAG2447917.1 hypothetical protein HYH02_007371 [Chlamydomonas schloesseri]
MAAGASDGDGDEQQQQLRAAVQDFVGMPAACILLLRDLLLEDAATASDAKQALLQLLPMQLEAVDSCGSGVAGGKDKPRVSLKTKLGLGNGRQAAGADNGCGASSGEGGAAVRSSNRIALSLMLYLFCFADSAEQAHQALMAPAAAEDAGSGANGSTSSGTGATPSGTKQAVQKLLKACAATLRAAPLVPGCGDVPVDLLRPLQGLPELGSMSAPWEAASGTLLPPDATALEERYGLSLVSVYAAHDYGLMMEQLLALKLQVEAAAAAAAPSVEAVLSGAGGSSQHAAGNVGAATSAALLGLPQPAQVALGRLAAGVAGRALRLLQDWQTAVLQLDTLRTWQQQQRRLRDAEEAGDAVVLTSASRCAMTGADATDVVRMVAYVKGLAGLLQESLPWLEPLLAAHCAAQLGQLLSAVLAPVAQGTLAMPPAAEATGAAAAAAFGLPPPSPSRARGGDSITPSGGMSALDSNFAAATEPATSAAGGNSAALARGLGRLWKAKAASHRRNVSSEALDNLGSLTPPGAPNEAEPEADDADTPGTPLGPPPQGIPANWTPSRVNDFQPDPYTRLRDWFASGNTPQKGAAAAAGGDAGAMALLGAAPLDLDAPLATVMEGLTPRSGTGTPVPGSGSRQRPPRPCASPGGVARVSAGSPSAIRGLPPLPRQSPQQQQQQQHNTPGGTTDATGTEEGGRGEDVECTVSSASERDPQELVGMQGAGHQAQASLDLDSGSFARYQGGMPGYGHGYGDSSLCPPPQLGAPPLPPLDAVPAAPFWLQQGGTDAGFGAPALDENFGGVQAAAVSGPGRAPGSVAGGSGGGGACLTNPLFVYPSEGGRLVATRATDPTAQQQHKGTVEVWVGGKSDGGAAASAAAPPPLALPQEDGGLHMYGGAGLLGAYAADAQAGGMGESGPAQPVPNKKSSSRFKSIKKLFGIRRAPNSTSGDGDSSKDVRQQYLTDGVGYIAAPPEAAGAAHFGFDAPMLDDLHMSAHVDKYGNAAHLSPMSGAPAVHGFGGVPLPSGGEQQQHYGMAVGEVGVVLDEASASGHQESALHEGLNRDGAFAMLSVGPQGAGGAQHKEGAGGKAQQQQLGRFLEVVAQASRKRDERSCNNLQQLATELQMFLSSAGYALGSNGRAAVQLPAPAGGAEPSINVEATGPPGGIRKASTSLGGAKASIKKLVTSFKGRSNGGRQASAGAHQDGPAMPALASPAEYSSMAAGPVYGSSLPAAQQAVVLEERDVSRLKMTLEMMAAELAALVAHRRLLPRASKASGSTSGPSLVSLLALSSELQMFLAQTFPPLMPLLAFRANVAVAADLSALLATDPARTAGPNGPSGARQSSSDARGSMPWELVCRGILAADSGGPSSADARRGGAGGVPLASALTVLSLFGDAVEAAQAQELRSDCPDTQNALSRQQQLYRRQAKWCLDTFVHAAARRIWATYKAQALRSELGVAVPPGAPDVAPDTAALQDLMLLQPQPLQPRWGSQQQTRGAPGPRCADSCALVQLQALVVAVGGSSGAPELQARLAAAVDDLVRQCAARTAALALGSDLTALAAVKQQVDVLSAAVARVHLELPGVRPWADTWLGALAAAAASAPTCAPIAEAAAATAAAVAQGCSAATAAAAAGGDGLGVGVDDILMTHMTSEGVLRALSTWAYDMRAVQFTPTKHTRNYWEQLCRASAAFQAVASPPVHRLDGADLALAAATAGTSGDGGSSRAAGSSNGAFGRPQVLALHSLLGLDGVGRLVAALRSHITSLLTDASPLLRRVHELYDGGVAGPRGPGLRGAGGAMGYLQLQQRWLRDRGHTDMLVSANRAMQAIGNSVAAVALLDSVLAELAACRSPHLLPLAASTLQADQCAHAALQAMANADAAAAGASSLLPPPAVSAVAPPPAGTGFAGLLLGLQGGLPPGLAGASQPAVAAAALVQDRIREQLPPAFGLPGLWRAMFEAIHQHAAPPAQRQPYPQQVQGQTLFAPARLWCVLQTQLCCLTPEEQAVHAANVGDGVYVAAAAAVQLATGAPLTPGSVLLGDTTTALQQAAALEAMKAQLATVSTASGAPTGQSAAAAVAAAAATLEQLQAWSARAELVRSSWDAAVQLTVGAGATAARLAAEPQPDRAALLASCLSQAPLTAWAPEPWMALVSQAALAGAAMQLRAAAPPPPSVSVPSQQVPGGGPGGHSMGGRAGQAASGSVVPPPSAAGGRLPPGAVRMHSTLRLLIPNQQASQPQRGPPLPSRNSSGAGAGMAAPGGASGGPDLSRASAPQPRQLLSAQSFSGAVGGVVGPGISSTGGAVAVAAGSSNAPPVLSAGPLMGQAWNPQQPQQQAAPGQAVLRPSPFVLQQAAAAASAGQQVRQLPAQVRGMGLVDPSVTPAGYGAAPPPQPLQQLQSMHSSGSHAMHSAPHPYSAAAAAAMAQPEPQLSSYLSYGGGGVGAASGGYGDVMGSAGGASMLPQSMIYGPNAFTFASNGGGGAAGPVCMSGGGEYEAGSVAANSRSQYGSDFAADE